jgi:radical SAM superfamily enzyme YgiQ (UPF0313 family)
LDFPTLDRFERELATNDYDVVGIGSILANVGKVKAMCESVRRLRPSATIVVGGHIANLPDLDKHIDADHIVKGEGVRWFRRFLGEDENRPFRHIVSHTGFAFRALGSNMPKKAALGSAVVVPSVGCPMGCNFCSTSAMYGGKGKFVNFYETGDELYSILEGLERELGTEEFLIIDENFLLHRPRALRLLELMEKNDKAWGFSVFSSASVLNSYPVEDLVRIGVTRVWIGLEGKNSQYAKIGRVDTRELVRRLQDNGIFVVGSSIIGLEEHSPENIDEAIDFAVSHASDFHQFMLYTPLPGTPLHEELTARGDMRSFDEVPLADRHGQQRFAHRHPRIPEGMETEFLLRAFRRDFDVNGPSLLRAVRTALSGWRRYKDHPEARLRRRHARRAASLPGAQAGALWAGIRWFRDTPPVASKIATTLEEVRKSFGWKARLAAPIVGRIILWNLRREAARLERGWTSEPQTFY